VRNRRCSWRNFRIRRSGIQLVRFNRSVTHSSLSFSSEIWLKHVLVVLNDLWRFRISDSTWTWLAGELTGAQAGSYGTKGSGVSGVTVPPSRLESTGWFDVTNRQFGILGGGLPAPANTGFSDSWIYDVASNTWTWTSGVQGAVDSAGSYPPINRAVTQYDLPARSASSVIYDPNTIQRLLFGGTLANSGSRNDVWLFQSYENCSSILSGISGSSCHRYNDTDSFLVPLSVPITVLAPNVSQCAQVPYPPVVVSSCGSIECVRPSACPPLGNSSDYSTTTDLCYTNYSSGGCPSGSACNDLGACKLLLGEACTGSSQCYSTFVNLLEDAVRLLAIRRRRAVLWESARCAPVRHAI
jgi:hypothetical protein